MLLSALSVSLLVTPSSPPPGPGLRVNEGAPDRAWGEVLTVAGSGSSLARGVAICPDDSVIVTGSFEGTLTLAGTELKEIGIFGNTLVVKYTGGGKAVWARQATSRPNEGYNEGTDAAVDKEGDIFVCGQFADEIHFGSGVSLATPDPLYIRTFLVKYSPDGKPLWARDGKGIETGTGKEVVPTSVVVDGEGDVYLCAEFYDQATFGSHQLDGNDTSVALVKYDGQSGKIEWVVHSKGNGTNRACNADVDSKGNVYLFVDSWMGFKLNDTYDVHGAQSFNTATVVVKLSPQGEYLWQSRCLGYANGAFVGWGAALPGGGAVTCARLAPTTGILPSFGGKRPRDTCADSQDSVVCCLDAEGNPKWMRLFGGPDDERGRCLAVDDKGDLLVSGWMEGGGAYGPTQLTSRGEETPIS